MVEGALDYDEALNFDEWSAIDTENLSERVAANNWVSTKTYQGRIIVKMQGDSISKEAASNMFSKYAERAMSVLNKPDGITTYYLDPETRQVVSGEGIVIPAVMQNKLQIIIVIEPWKQKVSLPAINISTSDKENEIYMIYLPISRNDFVWAHVDNDLILFNNEDDPSSSTIKLRFMDTFEKEKVIRNSLRVVFEDTENGKMYRYNLSSLLSVFNKVNYQE